MGQSKFLPTQGAYNLWAANKPGSHGKYFEQSVIIANTGNHDNPARLESEILYRQEVRVEMRLI